MSSEKNPSSSSTPSPTSLVASNETTSVSNNIHNNHENNNNNNLSSLNPASSGNKTLKDAVQVKGEGNNSILVYPQSSVIQQISNQQSVIQATAGVQLGEQFVYEGYGHEDDRESRSSHESDHQDPHREHQQQQRHLHRDEHEPHFYVPAVPPLSSEKDREPVSSSDELIRQHELSGLEDESKKRREVLERRPSYRKILNDLSSAEVSAIAAQFNHPQDLGSLNNNNNNIKTSKNNNQSDSPSVTNSNITSASLAVVSGHPMTVSSSGSFVKVVPASTIQLAPGPGSSSSEGSLPSLTALTVANTSSGGPVSSGGGGHNTGTIVQYAHSQDGPFFVPAYANGVHHPISSSHPYPPSAVTVSAADLQAYQFRAGTNSASISPAGIMMTGSNLSHLDRHSGGNGPPVEEASKKRELRLLKNREAAKECRRKKKEYIKCLENRVAVLENQNKALIEELKSLKELYCSKGD